MARIRHRYEEIEPIYRVQSYGRFHHDLSYCSEIVGGIHLWMCETYLTKSGAERAGRRWKKKIEAERQAAIVAELMEGN